MGPGQANRQGVATKNSLNATCFEIKQSVNKEQSISNYSIKAKHFKKLNCFFQSKHFELVTDMEPTEINDETGKKKDLKSKKS